MSIHVVHFSGPINLATAERLRDTCLDAVREGATDLRLHFSSGGGQNMPGFTLYNFLRSLPVAVTIHNLSNVQSTAVIVYLAGRRRLVCPQGRFLIHPLHWSFDSGQVDHARLREYVGSLDNDLERYAEIFEARTGGAASPLDVRSHLSGREQERIVNAREAVTAGIAHAVEDATIPEGATTWGVSSGKH